MRLGVKLKMIAANKSAAHPLVSRQCKSNTVLIYRTWNGFIAANSSLPRRVVGLDRACGG